MSDANDVSEEISSDNAEFGGKLKYLADLKNKIYRIVADFFVSLEKNDFIERILDLEIEDHYEQIPKILISVSFDRTDKERRVAADLLIHLIIKGVIGKQDLDRSLKILLSRIYELIVDIPAVVGYLEYFVNRFIDSKSLDYGEAKDMLDLLSLNHSSTTKHKTTIKKIVTKIIDNYFTTEELDECIKEIEEIKDPMVHPLVVKYSVSLSLDRGNHERELISRLFANVVDDKVDTDFIKRSSLEEGFLILLNCVEDLYDDVPYVYQYLSIFIARAVFDDCLAPSFLKRVRTRIGGDAYIVLKNVEELLEMENRAEELPKIWDCNIEDFDQIKHIVAKNVQAYFDSKGDDDSFRKFMHDLAHPHFHYQVVYQLFDTLLDRDQDYAEKVSVLIDSFFNLGISTKDEILKGFKKIERILPELKIDVPNAEEVYKKVRDRVKTIKS